MRVSLLAILALLASACASPTAPTTAPTTPPHEPMHYTINMPGLDAVAAAQRAYPAGFAGAPLVAQAQFDYTAVYGVPNVYAGAQSGAGVAGTGLLTAPEAVAAKPTFTAADWPGIGLAPGVVYEWVGEFTYTRAN